jgi:DNA-binding transcriptional MocR family regulator
MRETAQPSGVCIGVDWLSAHVDDRSPRGIASAVHRLTRSKDIGPGDRLPTVRAFAHALGVSPATVNEAWRALGAAGAIEARGRAGTFVRAQAEHAQPARYLGIGGAPLEDGALDLSTGTPDPALLPSLDEAFQRFGADAHETAWTSSYLDPPVLPQLAEYLATAWPFHVSDMTVVDGALDALSRVVDIIVGFGDRVVMESPGFPPLIDVLDRAGAEILAVPMDEQGMVTAELAQALKANPTAVFLQPRAQNPTGTSMTRLRASELAEVLRTHQVWVVEDDHCGEISTAADVSIGQFFPDRCIHIRSFSKSHGPDLRIAAISGPADVIEPLVARRMLGPGWTSRILQSALLELLTHETSRSAVQRARATYARRGTILREALRDLGVETSPGDGINMWVPVADERSALISLAASGIRVAPGSPFLVGGALVGGPGVRVTSGRLPDDVGRIQDIANLIARASGTSNTAGR